jgi:hypothetical protein
MKKTLLAISITLAAAVGYSQGTVSTINQSTSLILTNNAITSASGPISGANNYYFALLTAAMPSFGTPAAAPTSLQLANATGWTYTGISMASIASAGRENGGANIATITGWGAGVTNSYVVVGWSASLGTTWSTVASEITSGTWSANGYFGMSSVAFGEAGGGAQSLPAFNLFGSGPTAAGTPLMTGFSLNNVNAVPEPGTLALMALGSASLLLFRRKK